MRRLGTLGLSLGVALLAAASAWAQVSVVQDFEGPLPGPQTYPGGYSFHGGGIGDPIVTEAIIDTDAAAGIQSYEVTVDATNNAGSYFYYGLGGFHGFFATGAGFAQGQPGEDDPGNYRMTFDLKVSGNDGDQAATPVGGAVGLYRSDYEIVNNVDLNGDGTIGPVEGGASGGYDTWHSTFVASVTDNDWTHIVWDLDSGTAPTTNGSIVPAPVFDDESTFFFQIFFNSGGFGVDANNIIRIDNVALEFTPATSNPGDFDTDGDVDGRDFLAWQRGESPAPLSATDLTDWQNNYGTGGGLASFAAVPEPGSLLLALSAAMLVGYRRR
jgi:hypothetical protein